VREANASLLRIVSRRDHPPLAAGSARLAPFVISALIERTAG